jgi:hypothetical protein
MQDDRYRYDPNEQWYLVSVIGIDGDGKQTTAEIEMCGDLQGTVEVWARDHGWFYAEIVTTQPTLNPLAHLR